MLRPWIREMRLGRCGGSNRCSQVPPFLAVGFRVIVVLLQPSGLLRFGVRLCAAAGAEGSPESLARKYAVVLGATLGAPVPLDSDGGQRDCELAIALWMAFAVHQHTLRAATSSSINSVGRICAVFFSCHFTSSRSMSCASKASATVPCSGRSAAAFSVDSMRL